MAVVLCSGKNEIKYDFSKPLEPQLKNIKVVRLNLNKTPFEAQRFLDILASSIKLHEFNGLKFEIISSNQVLGFKFKKKCKSIDRYIQLCNLAAFLSCLSKNTEQSLDKIACDILKLAQEF